MTSENWLPGFQICVDGTDRRLRPGLYTLEWCDCCPDHLIWHYPGDSYVCSDCWSGNEEDTMQGDPD